MQNPSGLGSEITNRELNWIDLIRIRIQITALMQEMCTVVFLISRYQDGMFLFRKVDKWSDLNTRESIYMVPTRCIISRTYRYLLHLFVNSGQFYDFCTALEKSYRTQSVLSSCKHLCQHFGLKNTFLNNTVLQFVHYWYLLPYIPVPIS